MRSMQGEDRSCRIAKNISGAFWNEEAKVAAVGYDRKKTSLDAVKDVLAASNGAVAARKPTTW